MFKTHLCATTMKHPWYNNRSYRLTQSSLRLRVHCESPTMLLPEHLKGQKRQRFGVRHLKEFAQTNHETRTRVATFPLTVVGPSI